MFDLSGYLDEKKEIINKTLSELIEKFCVASKLVDAMKYSLMGNGKRLRPILCIAANEAVKGDIRKVTDIACAIEMIHTYSLIHDDLPAMDNDDLRRGRPTCHKQFDEATAILTGDALLTIAFQILSTERSFIEPSLQLKIINIIATASGHNGMIEGQMRDMEAETKQLALPELKTMHALKTGAIIQASVHVGAIIGNATQKQTDLLIRYASDIGLAFQVQDDLLNVFGDSKLMGKATGTDQKNNKSTFPKLLGLDASKAFSSELVKNAIKAIEFFDHNADPLRHIANYIISRDI